MLVLCHRVATWPISGVCVQRIFRLICCLVGSVSNVYFVVRNSRKVKEYSYETVGINI